MLFRSARGVDHRWVRSLYRFAVVPTLSFYFRVPLEVALRRVLSARPKIKWYEAGMDLGLHQDPKESYKSFQAKIMTEYEQQVEDYGLTVMDAVQPVQVQQRTLRRAITPHLPRPVEGVAHAGA